MRADLQSGEQIVAIDLLVAFELDLLDHRPLDHMKGQGTLAVDVVDRSLDVLDKPHRIDRAHVLLDDRRIGGLAELASDPHADGALHDLAVAGTANRAHVRFLGDGDRAEGQYPEQQDRAEASHHEIRASYQMVVGVYSTTAGGTKPHARRVHADVTPSAGSSRPSCKRMTRSMAA